MCYEGLLDSIGRVIDCWDVGFILILVFILFDEIFWEVMFSNI